MNTEMLRMWDETLKVYIMVWTLSSWGEVPRKTTKTSVKTSIYKINHYSI